jgi:hypothetical protein
LNVDEKTNEQNEASEDEEEKNRAEYEDEEPANYIIEEESLEVEKFLFR